MKPPSGGEKQTQFKPNQTQSPKGQNERKLNFNKGLQKKRWFRSPNKQTQFLQRPKMNVNAFSQKDYENEPPSGPKKTNPIQTQFKPNSCGFLLFAFCFWRHSQKPWVV